MEALVQCRKEHPYSKFWGACSDITWELSNCLKHEKKVRDGEGRAEGAEGRTARPGLALGAQVMAPFAAPR